MDETSATTSIGRERSSTFGAYASVTRELNCLSHGENLTVSTMRSMFSGVGISRGVGGRPRSSTWHGAVNIQTKQVEQHVTTAPPCLKTTSSSTAAPKWKIIFDDIINKELCDHLGGNCGLMNGQEFANKSSVISKAIGKKASQIVDDNTKIVASVYIGEIRGDGIEVASQCLLDPALDAFASGNFKNASIFAVGTLFVASFKRIIPS